MLRSWFERQVRIAADAGVPYREPTPPPPPVEPLERRLLHQALAAEDPLETLALLENACAVAPQLTDAWIQRGLALEKLERHAEAQRALEQAIRLYPAGAVARYHLARICHAVGDGRRAMAQLALVRRLVPDYRPAILLQARVHAQAGHHRAAIGEFERALMLNADDTKARQDLAGARLALRA
jgi:tetratricopeptide (TPR) repeat protein